MHIRVRVTAKSKKPFFLKESKDKFSIGVRAPAEENRANRAAQDALANYFEIPSGSVHLVRGHKSPSKIFSVDLRDKRL